MPYPNYHSARVRSVDDFKKGGENWITKELTKGILAVMGRLKNPEKDKNPEALVIQSYRFDKTIFSPEQAKEWLKKHNINAIEFEPAKEESINWDELKRVLLGILNRA